MRKPTWAMVLGSALFLSTVAAVAQQSAAKPPAAPAAKPAPAQAPATAPAAASGFVPVASIKEIMAGIVDPTSKVLFNAVSVEATQAGTKTKAPETAADWALVRRNAVILAEAGNLLKMAGRRAEPAGAATETSPENLTPAQIQAAIGQDRAGFNRFAQGLTDAALAALKAIDAKSTDGVSDAGEKLDSACENCHLKFWYPPKK
jgi:hypothetical protein